ncbi:uncharacterized protein LOC132190651 [Corylus avellana]|uniref:uncharacterized protein LOC132190403 n=1 Tax=Corylus avellana TaxID=13451 RepID=UPI00286D4974|nr:uncharacterized protein LOC132190403 [Corylus avellana]XP_059461673.1 uncharacterized protein LOC132190651 [Corylus avellana]
MGTNERSDVSSERRKWDKIFNGLVHMLQTQQEQLETLAQERKLLEDCVRMQHERWVSDARLYEGQISRMNGDLVAQQMTLSFEAAKSDFVTSLKRREAFLEKLKLEDAETELADFKAWFDYFSRESCDPKVLSLRNGSDMQGEERRSKILEGEIRRLKSEYEKLALEKSSEVSALLAEKKFVWNQYKIMENDYTSKLGSNRSEVAKANETIEKLLSRVKQLQSLNDERDEMIARLRNKVAETNKLNEATSRTSHKLDLLKKPRSSSVTPALNYCTARAQRSCVVAKKSGSNRSDITGQKESSAAQFPDSEKGSRVSKRKGVDVFPISETPRLFSSDFKVPKLKTHLR